MKIYFVRHGETQWNTEKRFQGSKNSPLTALGWEQARKIAKDLKEIPFAALYSSSLGRARDTVLEVAKGREMEAEILDEFIEIHMGNLEGRTKMDFAAEFPEQYENYVHASTHYDPRIYGGESFSAIQERIQRGLEKITKRHQEGENVLVVSHGMTLQILFAYLRHGNLEKMHEEILPKNTELRIVEYREGAFRILQG